MSPDSTAARSRADIKAFLPLVFSGIYNARTATITYVYMCVKYV